MKSDKQLLIDRLERIFPGMEMVLPSQLFNQEKDCLPERRIDWWDVLKELDRHGLAITKKK